MKEACFLNKKCVPCEGGVPPLGEKEIQQLLLELGADWKVSAKGHLHKEYIFKNFMDAIDFANKIAVIAESEGHHPDLSICWGRCAVELWTHAVDGLTENDFIVAAKVDNL